MISIQFNPNEDLSRLTDDQLQERNVKFQKGEQMLVIEALRHLRETEKRRLYAKFKCSSLFDYCVKVLGYTEDQIGPRMSAMRLMRVCPEIEEKIAGGSLSVTNVSKARTMFNQEVKAGVLRTPEEKLQVLEKIEHCTKKEAEVVLRAESKIAQPDLIGGDWEKLFINTKLKEKLERIRDVKAHTHPHLELIELIEMMADLAIEAWDPLKKAERAAAREAKKKNHDAVVPVPERVNDVKSEPVPAANGSTVDVGQSLTSKRIFERSRGIRARARHTVFLRGQAKCTNCGSRRLSEIDHKHEFAKGGSSSEENLQLLCRPCNQRKAIETYGIEKMSRYLREPRAVYAS